MKKTVVLLLALYLMIGIVTVSHATMMCEGGKHQWGSWQPVNGQPLCGTVKECRYCNECVSGYEERTVQKDHEWSAWTWSAAVAEPKCGETGTQYRYCSRCQASESRTATMPHSWSEYQVTKRPTCTEAGTETRTCAKCGTAETNDIPLLGHTIIIDPYIAPTYSTSGLTEDSHCDVCHTVLEAQREIPRLGPVYSGTGGQCGENVTWVLDGSGTLTISGTGAMYNCEDASPWSEMNISSVIVRNGVTAIGDYTFRGCSSLTAVSLPAGLTDIGDYAFYGCSGITRMVLPDGVARIGCYAFARCSGMRTIRVPSSVTVIAADAFQNSVPAFICDADSYVRSYALIRGFDIIPACDPDKHEPVSGEAVSPTCTEPGLTSGSYCGICGEVIEVPAVIPPAGHHTVTDPYVAPTMTSSGLTEGSHCDECGAVFKAQEEIPMLDPDPDVITGTCGTGLEWVLDGSGTLTITGSGVITTRDRQWESLPITNVVIGSGVTGIGENAFQNCTGITNVTLPDSLTVIGSYAFDHCSGLSGITIPGSVTGIGIYAFNCSGLTGITLPDGITYIGKYAFANCSSLSGVTLPDSLTAVGEATFFNCASLTGITIPDSVTTIGSGAFAGCTALTDITIPAGVTAIAADLFGTVRPVIHCPGNSAAHTYAAANGYEFVLTDAAHEHDIVDDEAIAPTCTEPGLTAGSHCRICGETILAQTEVPATGHTPVTDPYTAPTYVAPGRTEGSHCETCGAVILAQQDIPVLVSPDVVQIPAGVTAVAEEAFYGCGAKQVTLSASCESIGPKAFADCEDLSLVEIPAGVTSIAADAFDGSDNVVIKTTDGSYADSYARSNEIDLWISFK